MGFLSGRAAFLRFRVAGPAPAAFSDDHLDRLRDRAAGRQRVAAADGVETGWTAGDSVLDTDFALEKNVFPGHLHCAFRVDTDRVPADLLRAYSAAELKALAKDNPSGLPSARQRREAKEAAREQLEQEAKDGRYRKRKCVPVLWDARAGEVLFGGTSLADVDRFAALFGLTFGVGLEAVTAGTLALAATPGSSLDLFANTRHGGLACSAFVPGSGGDEMPAWITSVPNGDWLGNELLLWLWYHAEVVSDTLRLPDGSDAAVMLARTLTLECPRGQTGADAFAHAGPARLPEARRAAQAGKLPRKAGLTVVRHDRQYEFRLHAETFGVAGAKLPAPDDDVQGVQARAEDRFARLRDLCETLDGLYAAFLARRLGPDWPAELASVRRWLARPEGGAA